jgi:hypothetical protein
MSEQNFVTPEPVRLEIKVAAGDLRVTSVEGNQSTVTLEGPPRIVDATTVEQIGDRLVVGQRRRSYVGLLGRSDSSLVVRAGVPHGSRIEISTASGEAILDGTFAGLDLRSASGSLSSTGALEGSAVAKTASGEVRLAHVAGDLDVQTVSGDVAAETVGGSARVKSISGDVHIGSMREGVATVQSVSGNVALGIASGTNVDVDAGSSSGHLTTEIPLADAPGVEAGPTVVVRSKSVSGGFRLFRAA